MSLQLTNYILTQASQQEHSNIIKLPVLLHILHLSVYIQKKKMKYALFLAL